MLVREQIGVLGMKAMGDQFILSSGVVTATECLHYAMTLPTSVWSSCRHDNPFMPARQPGSWAAGLPRFAEGYAWTGTRPAVASTRP